MTRFHLEGQIRMRSNLIASLALLFLLPMVCHADAPAPASSTAPAPAGQSAPHPVWPENGVAQRRFPGAFNMFVENHDGQWHAWVMSGLGAQDAKALDFFTGKVMKVTAQLDEDTQQQDFSFTDPAGHDHFPRGTKFEVESQRDLPDGLVMSSRSLDLDGTDCTEYLGAIVGGSTSHERRVEWAKVPLYRNTPAPAGGGCRSGQYLTGFDSTLDLGDGTFLAVTGCWIFRLRISDLEPAGAAPGLRVVEAAAVRKAIDQAKGKRIDDAATYLAKALHLDINDANSCK